MDRDHTGRIGFAAPCISRLQGSRRSASSPAISPGRSGRPGTPRGSSLRSLLSKTPPPRTGVHGAAVHRGRSWYAVLGLRPEAAVVTHEDIKRQYRRLCLVLHPDKRTAWRPPTARSSCSSTRGRRSPPPPAGSSPRLRLQAVEGASAAAATGAPPSSWARTTGPYGSRPPSPDWSSFGFTPPPEPDGSAFNFKAWRAAYARTNGKIYCGHCDADSAAEEGAGHGVSGSAGGATLAVLAPAGHRMAGLGVHVHMPPGLRAPRRARGAARGSRRRFPSACVTSDAKAAAT
ncbi:hypothetical protein C2845_PM11G09660 [Panicum miliaceum]|uniref:J domain-containing protein n=1 Tax=Panicum miliaceum TaxID=4540 RepID=A0A3L6RU74_PANMI|nr:hypothetical protein C2845_PM11G09660 [Panicum miliaceum]